MRGRIISATIYLLARARGYTSELAKVLVAQAHLESDVNYQGQVVRFGSKNAMVRKNLFGMQHPRKRPTKSIGADSTGEYGNAATYRNVVDSIIDRMMWDEYNGISKDLSTGLYLGALFAHGYNSSEGYFKSLTNLAVLDNIDKETKEGTLMIILGIGVLFMVGFIALKRTVK